MKWSHSGLTHCPSQGAFTPFSPSLTPPDPLQSFSHACLAPSPLIRSHPTNLKHLYSLFELYALICHRLCSVYVLCRSCSIYGSSLFRLCSNNVLAVIGLVPCNVPFKLSPSSIYLPSMFQLCLHLVHSLGTSTDRTKTDHRRSADRA